VIVIACPVCGVDVTLAGARGGRSLMLDRSDRGRWVIVLDGGAHLLGALDVWSPTTQRFERHECERS
jgi:hypothetical protein